MFLIQILSGQTEVFFESKSLFKNATIIKRLVIADVTLLHIVVQVLYETLSMEFALHNHDDDLLTWLFFSTSILYCISILN